MTDHLPGEFEKTEPRMALPEWLEELEHTADTGIIVRADCLKELFGRAAWGMFSVMVDLSAVQPKVAARVSVEATDQKALLVKWLSELNIQHVTKHWLFSRFDISELGDTHLSAEVYGEAIDPERHAIYTEIKAITFHDLRIEKEGERWKAQIIFDL
ncbi:MAG: archease [Verrucomicrobiales bacterium]|nr:archease [Verrucomicrobiales bacterium]